MGPSAWEEKLRLHGGRLPCGRGILGSQRDTRARCMCLRVYIRLRLLEGHLEGHLESAFRKAEYRGLLYWSLASDQPTHCCLFDHNSRPSLFTQNYLSRPQGQQWLSGLLDACRQHGPSPAHPLILLPPLPLSPAQLYGWHMEAISIYPQHQDAAARCAPASGILGFPAGPFQRLHAKQPAVCRERLGPLHQCRGGMAICAHGSSWAV